MAVSVVRGSFRVGAVVALVVLLFGPSSGWADGVRLQGVFDMGWDFGFGSTELVRLRYADGSTDSLWSGKGGRFVGGVLFAPFRVQGHLVELQVTGGIKGESTFGKADGSVRLYRGVMEALVFYRYEKAYLRVGGGLTYHFAPVLTASGTAVSLLGFESASLSPALGYIVQAEACVLSWLGVTAGLRYTFIEYPGVHGGEPVKSSGLGIVVSVSIGMDFPLHLTGVKS